MIVIRPGELAALGWASAVLDTDGVVWVSRERVSNMKAGWFSFGHDPKSHVELADGRPLLVLYSSALPQESLRGVREIAYTAVIRPDDHTDEEWVEAVPYYDFLVCWNGRHPENERFLLP